MRLLVSVLVLLLISSGKSERFKVIREWKRINFTWTNPDLHNAAFLKGTYIPENNIISGIDYYHNYFYLTLPRMKDGVPATITRIPAGNVTDTHPLLEPYPSWEMNEEGNCDAFQNVQNVEIDPKGQMWIIDSGRTETLNKPSSRCPPKLVIYDLKKNSTSLTYTFPENVASMESNFLYDLVVDDTDGGYAYITDNSAQDPGIIVFSMKEKRSWKIRHSKSMRADPSAIIFKVNSVIINTPLSLAGIALGPKIHKNENRIIVDDNREVYYSPISSLHIYSINTTFLRNEQNGENDGEFQGSVKDYGIKGSQSAGMIMNNEGVLYYTLLGSNSIARWDTRIPFESKQKIISRDENFLEWPASFTIDDHGYTTILVNKLNKFIFEEMNFDEPNFRLITSYTGDKSYLFNPGYDYSEVTNVTQPSVIQPDAPEPEILPGSDNDPYLIPHPIPEHAFNTNVTEKVDAETETETEPDCETSSESTVEEYETTKPQPEPQPKPIPNKENEKTAQKTMKVDIKSPQMESTPDSKLNSTLVTSTEAVTSSSMIYLLSKSLIGVFIVFIRFI